MKLRLRLWRLVNTDFSSAEKVLEFGGFICVLEDRELSLERYSLQESDVFYGRLIRQQIFEQPCISIIMGAAKYDLATMTIVEVEFEYFYERTCQYD